MTSKNLVDPAPEEKSSESAHKSIMVEYFNENTFDILQSVFCYLRRELKVPEYSLVSNEEDSEGLSKLAFEVETKEIFEKQPRLLQKLDKLQTVIRKIFEIINTEGSQVRVSFFVYESI